MHILWFGYSAVTFLQKSNWPTSINMTQYRLTIVTLVTIQVHRYIIVFLCLQYAIGLQHREYITIRSPSQITGCIWYAIYFTTLSTYKVRECLYNKYLTDDIFLCIHSHSWHYHWNWVVKVWSGVRVFKTTFQHFPYRSYFYKLT